VHLVVVLLPLTAAAAVLVSIWPPAQRKLTFLVPLGALVGAAAVPLTVRAGEDLAKRLGNPPFIKTHQEYGGQVLPWAVALLVTTAAQYALLRGDQARPRWMRWAVSLAVVVAAAGTGVMVFLTGDSGARAVWGDTPG
jgi:hypothetical protein